MQCPACNQPNRPTARYCNACGVSLTLAAQPRKASVQLAEPHRAEPHGPDALVQQPSWVMTVSAAPETAAPPVPAPAMVYAPYGYIPAPAPPGYAPASMPVPPGYAPLAAPAPSLVNNVTLTQAPPAQGAPAAAPQPQPIGADRPLDAVGVSLRALYFLISGIALGLLWSSIRPYDGGATIALALVLTIVVLLVHMLVLSRLARR